MFFFLFQIFEIINLLVLTDFCSFIGTVAMGTVLISNGLSVGSFKYPANARSNPTIETLKAKVQIIKKNFIVCHFFGYFTNKSYCII